MIYKFKQIVLKWIYVDDICAFCDDKLSLYKGECYSDCPTCFFKNGNICEVIVQQVSLKMEIFVNNVNLIVYLAMD